MVDGVSCIQESLGDNMSENVAKIDKVLRTIIQERRPGYLFIPCDVPDLPTPSNMLFEKPFSPLSQCQGTAHAKAVLNEVTDSILSLLYQSSDPSLLADCLITRFGAQKGLTISLKSYQTVSSCSPPIMEEILMNPNPTLSVYTWEQVHPISK